MFPVEDTQHTEARLRDDANWSYQLARQNVFDLEQPGKPTERTPYQLRLIAKLEQAEQALADYRALTYRQDDALEHQR